MGEPSRSSRARTGAIEALQRRVRGVEHDQLGQQAGDEARERLARASRPAGSTRPRPRASRRGRGRAGAPGRAPRRGRRSCRRGRSPRPAGRPARGAGRSAGCGSCPPASITLVERISAKSWSSEATQKTGTTARPRSFSRSAATWIVARAFQRTKSGPPKRPACWPVTIAVAPGAASARARSAARPGPARLLLARERRRPPPPSAARERPPARPRRRSPRGRSRPARGTAGRPRCPDR